MKKAFLVTGLVVGAFLLSACNDDAKEFDGNWKAISTADGKPLLKWMDERMAISCKDGYCHVESKSLNSGTWFTQASDWKVENKTTISISNGLESMHLNNGKIYLSNRVYEKQME